MNYGWICIPYCIKCHMLRHVVRGWEWAHSFNKNPIRFSEFK